MQKSLAKIEVIIYTTGSGFVAQLVRALPCHGRGREFESRRIRHIYSFRAVFCCMQRKMDFILRIGVQITVLILLFMNIFKN